VQIVRDGIAHAKRLGVSTVIIDTAGRLQIDEALMEELARIKGVANPCEILLVADAMTGQEATNVAKGFHDRLGITGVILTKLDGDTRGGAALSIHSVTGAPIKLVGLGEKLSALADADRKNSQLVLRGSGQETLRETVKIELYAGRFLGADATSAQNRLDRRTAEDGAGFDEGPAQELRNPRTRVREG
jgi:signal recognition particle subunit SRP54